VNAKPHTNFVQNRTLTHRKDSRTSVFEGEGKGKVKLSRA